MIQIIGLMIAAYIVFRVAEIIQRKDQHNALWVVVVFGLIAALIALLGAYSLIVQGQQVAATMPGIPGIR